MRWSYACNCPTIQCQASSHVCRLHQFHQESHSQACHDIWTHNEAHQEKRKLCKGTSTIRSLWENLGHCLRVYHVSLSGHKLSIHPLHGFKQYSTWGFSGTSWPEHQWREDYLNLFLKTQFITAKSSCHGKGTLMHHQISKTFPQHHIKCRNLGSNGQNICYENAKHTSQWVLHQCILISQENMVLKLNTMKARKILELTNLSGLTRSTTGMKCSQAEVYTLELVWIENRFISSGPLALEMGSMHLRNKIGSIKMSRTKLMTFKSLIWISLVQQAHIIGWSHFSLNDGATCMLNIIDLYFHLPSIWKQVKDFVKICNKCQKYKINGKRNNGKIPLKSALCEHKPWAVIHVDCNSPWIVPPQSCEASHQATKSIAHNLWHIYQLAWACNYA